MERKKCGLAAEAWSKASFFGANALDRSVSFIALMLLAATVAYFSGLEIFEPVFAETISSTASVSTQDNVNSGFSYIAQNSPTSYHRSISESLSMTTSYGSGSSLGNNGPVSYQRSISESLSVTTTPGKAPTSYSRSMLEQTSLTTGMPPSSSAQAAQPQRTSPTPYSSNSNQRIEEKLNPLKILGKKSDTTVRNVIGGTPLLATVSLSPINLGSDDQYSEIGEGDQDSNPDDSSSVLGQIAPFNYNISVQKSMQNAALVDASFSSVYLLGAITVVMARQPSVSGGRMQRRILAFFRVKQVVDDNVTPDKKGMVPLNCVLLVLLIVVAAYSIAVAIDPLSGQAFAANLAVNKVQSGSLTLGTNPTDVTITSVDTTKAFAVCYSGTTSSSPDNVATCNLTSSTNLRVQAGIAGSAIAVTWYVVEFKEGAVVQRGETAWTTDTVSEDIAISSVDLTKSFAIINSRTTSTSQTADEQRTTRAALTSSTNLQLSRSGPGFPSVSAPTTTTFGTDSTTHNVLMPATIASGDLLLVLFTNDGSATVTTPGGWTSINTAVRSTFARGSIFAKIAAGTEDGTTVNFATSASEAGAAQVYLVPTGNWYGNIASGIASASVDPGGTTSSPDPPSLSPSWGSNDDLWLVYWASSSSASVTSYPTNYASGTHTIGGSGNTGAAVSSATRQLAASSDDPGTYSLPAAVSGVVFTIAIRPKPYDMATTHTWQVVELQDTVVQSGTTSLSGVSSTTASVSAVDLAETFLVFSTEGATAIDGVEAQYYVRGRFTSTTQITFDRNSSTNSATVSWFAVSVDRSSVQSGTNAATTTETTFDNTITAVSLTRASPFVSTTVGSTGTADQDSGQWNPSFTSTTNLRVTRQSASSTPSNIAWFAVEWPSAAREFSEQLGVTENAARTHIYPRSVSEQLGVVANTARTSIFTRSASEQLGVTESTARTPIFTRSASEQLGVTESVVKRAIKALSEQLGITESVVRSAIMSSSAADSLAVSESVAVQVSRTQAISEQLGMTETVNRSTITSRSISDSLAMSESPAVQMSRTRTMSEQLGITESVARSAIMSSSAADNLAVSESVAVQVSRTRTMSEQLGVSETPNASTSKALTDSLAVTESIGKTVLRLVAASDSMAITETVAKLASKLISDNLAVTETPAITVLRSVSTSDSLALSESIVTTVSRAITDQFGLTESVTKSTTKPMSEQLGITESVARSAIMSSSAADNLAVSESVAVQVSRTRTMSDSLAISETISVRTSKSATDSLSLTETVSKSVLRPVSAADSLAVTEVITIHISKATSDQLAISETVAARISAVITSDTIAVSEIIAVSVSKAVSDQLGITELVSTSITKSLSDTLSIADSIFRLVSRPASESMSLSESIVTGTSKLPSDNLAVSESIAKSVSRAGTATEQLTVSESILASVFGDIQLADQLAATESISIKVTTSLVDSLALSESVMTLGSTSMLEAIGMTDTVSAFAVITRSISDDLAVGEAISTTPVILVAITDSMGINEGFANIAVLFNLNLSEPLVMAQSFTTDFTGFFNQVDSEGIIIADNIALALDSILSTLDLMSLQEQILVLQTNGRVLVESMQTLDSLVMTLVRPPPPPPPAITTMPSLTMTGTEGIADVEGLTDPIEATAIDGTWNMENLDDESLESLLETIGMPAYNVTQETSSDDIDDMTMVLPTFFALLEVGGETSDDGAFLTPTLSDLPAGMQVLVPIDVQASMNGTGNLDLLGNMTVSFTPAQESGNFTMLVNVLDNNPEQDVAQESPDGISAFYIDVSIAGIFGSATPAEEAFFEESPQITFTITEEWAQEHDVERDSNNVPIMNLFLLDESTGEWVEITADVEPPSSAVGGIYTYTATLPHFSTYVVTANSAQANVDNRGGGGSREFNRSLVESLLITGVTDLNAPIASEGRVIIKDITESLALSIIQPQTLHQRVITINDVSIAVNVVDVNSASFGTAIATLNFEITNKGNSTQELMLKYWYTDPATEDNTSYEAEQMIVVQAGGSIVKKVEIPFSSSGLYEIIIEAESAEGTLATTSIEINVPWLAVYLYIVVAAAITILLITIFLVIRALRPRSYVAGGSNT